MNNLNKKLDLFVNNTQSLRRKFIGHGGQAKRLAALIYTLEGKQMNADAVNDSFDVIKQNTRVFSMFRGISYLAIATKLSLSGNHEAVFNDTLEISKKLKSAKFRSSDYLAVAAYLIAINTTSSNYDRVIDRSRAFYDGMKKNGWFRTGQDDYIFSIMLGLSDIEPEIGIGRIQELYEKLKSEFKWAGAASIQALCQMLTLGGKTDEALQHLLCIRNTLRSNKIKLDRAFTLPSLGALSLLEIDGEVLANDLLEAQRYLRKQKGFGSFSISNQELLLFSSAIMTSAYGDELKSGVVAATSTSFINMIIAQQIAMMIAATTAATAAAAS